ncbi:MAG TPA: DinB family protein [Hyphomonadaceae bacterium]|nr:DinB family protein [Hyphomonadaceae bacterium]
MLQVFQRMAAYNQWANTQLYLAAAKLEDETRWREIGLFFGSLGATLNHLLVTDRIWMRRFTGVGEHPDKLNAILHRDFDELRAAREAEDRRIVAWVGTLSEEKLVSKISYTTITRPMPVTATLWPDLLHVFNHQTHHRGQAHTALSILTGEEPPPLDLLFVNRMA